MTDKKDERKLKLIWDFRGPDSTRTAEHHALHLKEFVKTNDISLNITGFEKVNPDYSTAYIVVHESEMKAVRDALKPHRGQVYEE
ncbi:hypothetical protein [Salinimicrobium soli]|uniref:hypothetical protein n=1 Tax=Salinimicrobium soli TaxID=1254399 RepID=UPI003AADFFFC